MNRFLIAGIAASAGGIPVIQKFFESTPANSGIAYIVILHLSSHDDCRLLQVLKQSTNMPVTQVTEEITIEPDNVYVIPAYQRVEIADLQLLVSRKRDLADRRAPVDIFFRSLAETHGECAVSVVLSGTGADGSMGLKHIKSYGGIAFSQNPAEAEFDEMPQHAIATNMVDAVLNVADIPPRIINYRKALNSIQIPDQLNQVHNHDEPALRSILEVVRLATGHDFNNYKRSTLLRRTQRRMHVLNMPSMTDYAAFLAQHTHESQSLVQDLLIPFTNFFRDKKVFEELQITLFPQILKSRGSGGEVRIWVAGCATGEEAYSLAIICNELISGMKHPPRVKIFATDVDTASIAFAREGFYSANDLADVSDERLYRHFRKEHDGYRVRSELRDMVLFADHNFLKDPPFSRIDLISCRNVLIYLNKPAQERVFETFHFALNTEGYLLLGGSEAVEGYSERYTVYNMRHHIWQSRETQFKSVVIPEITPRHQSVALGESAILQAGVTGRVPYGELHLQLLELYAPPSLLINEEYEILHISEHAVRYLKIAGGGPTQNLLKMVREEIRTELRMALVQAHRNKTAVTASRLLVRTNDQTEVLNVHVRPLGRGAMSGAESLMLVVFEVVENISEIRTVGVSDEIGKLMEDEVLHLRAQLRIANETTKLRDEQLQSGNDELQAINEELQAASEEMMTRTEELKNVNEEIRTINRELKQKKLQSEERSNNLRDIINSTEIGIVILDRDLSIVHFTSAAQPIFNLIPSDIGRPLADITHHIRDENLVANARKVLRNLHRIIYELATTDGHIYLARFTVYRSDDDRIQGVVISLIDITEQKKIEELLEQRRLATSLYEQGASLDSWSKA